MHIGIVRDTYFTNEPRGLNIARALNICGFKISVLCFGKKDITEELDGITLVRFYLNDKIKRKISSVIETIPIYKYLWAKRIKKFIKKYNIEVLQVHDLYMLGPALKANKKYNLPIIANFHENYPAAIKSYNWANSFIGKLIVRPKIWEKLEGKYLKEINGLILLSESFKKLLLKKYGFLNPDNIVVYPNVPNLDEFEQYPIDKTVYKKNNEFIIFYFGVVAERRGFTIMFEALRILKNYQNIKILVIGPVDLSDRISFNSYTNDPEIKDNIIYFNWKDIRWLPSYLSISDVCISPILKNAQHDSGVANKIFQYMLFGKPLVVSNSSEQERIVKDNNCGLVYTFDDPKEMADKILKLYKNPQLCSELGTNGRKAVLKTYNSIEQSKKIINLYNKLELSIQYEDM